MSSLNTTEADGNVIKFEGIYSETKGTESVKFRTDALRWKFFMAVLLTRVIKQIRVRGEKQIL